MMSSDMETEDVGEVAPEAPQPTHIDVHITQESVLAKLLLAGWSALQLPASASSRGLESSRFLVTSWVVQIVLGLLSVVLGGILCICQYLAMNTSGAPFWTGIAAMLAGAVAFLHKKRGGTCWALLRTLLVLANFCMAVAAIVLGALEFHTYRYYHRDNPLLISLQAMLLGVWVLLLLASLIPVCVYLWKRFFTKAKTDEKKLLAANVI